MQNTELHRTMLCTKLHIGLRVQTEHWVSEEKDSFYVILKRKDSFCQHSNPRLMDYEANPLPLSYLTCSWWMDMNLAYIKHQICLYTNQSSVRIVTKWEIVNNLEQNAVIWACCNGTAYRVIIDYEYCKHTIGHQVVYPKVQLLLLDLVSNNGVSVD